MRPQGLRRRRPTKKPEARGAAKAQREAGGPASSWHRRSEINRVVSQSFQGSGGQRGPGVCGGSSLLVHLTQEPAGLR